MLLRTGGELHHDGVETEVVVDLTPSASVAALGHASLQAACRDTRWHTFPSRERRSQPLRNLGVPPALPGSGYILGAVVCASLVACLLKRSLALQVSAHAGNYP